MLPDADWSISYHLSSIYQDLGGGGWLHQPFGEVVVARAVSVRRAACGGRPLGSRFMGREPVAGRAQCQGKDKWVLRFGTTSRCGSRCGPTSDGDACVLLCLSRGVERQRRGPLAERAARRRLGPAEGAELAGAAGADGGGSGGTRCSTGWPSPALDEALQKTWYDSREAGDEPRM